MEVINIKENEDGSADVTFEFTREEERLLLEVGVNTLLKQYIEEHEKNCSNCARYECLGCNNNDRWIQKGV